MANSKKMEKLMQERSEEAKKEKELRDQRIIELHNQGINNKTIAQRLGCGATTVGRVVRDKDGN